jgi:hypothetical protein
MPRQELIHLIGKYVTTCRMSKGKGLRLKDFDEPEKNWKFSPSGVQERNFWDDYMHAFEERSPQPHRGTRRGSSCRPTISGSAGSSSRRLSWRQWVSLDLPEARRREKKEIAAARLALLRKL